MKTCLPPKASGLLLAAMVCLLPSCAGDGNFTLLGYTTKPNYDCAIRTVRVPIFKNLSFRRGLEFDLTAAVVREIEQKTPYKVVGDDCDADAELVGTVGYLNKGILNRHQLNEVREAETTLAVEIVFRNLKTGEILSRPAKGPGAPPPPVNLPPGVIPPATGIQVMSIANFIPELGESITTAQKKNVDRLAVQIVSMMETPW